MIEGARPWVQALLGTTLTWALTALGAAAALVVEGNEVGRPHGCPPTHRVFQRLTLDASLGFAGGVMLAASYWSLLEPALEMAEASGLYGNWTFLPVSAGLALGAAFVWAADLFMDKLGMHSPIDLVLAAEKRHADDVPAAMDGGHGDADVISRGELEHKAVPSVECSS